MVSPKATGGITEKNGIPYVWGVPCIKDAEYKFSLNKFPVTIWLCPHCLQNISFENEDIFCVTGCHLSGNVDRGSYFVKYYEDETALKNLNKILKTRKYK
ncbi:MAG: hypothetical protein ACXVPN_11810 [Bacteroidia bacterium]